MKKSILTFSLIIFILTSSLSVYPQDFEWQQTNGLFGGTVYRIEITPTGIIYAAAGATLFRSDDYAQTWVKVNFEWAHGTTFISNGSGDILADSANTIKKSTDKGATWFTVADVGGRINDLSRNPQNFLFAATDSVIYRSTDGGENWSVLSTLPEGTQITALSTANDSVYYLTAFDKIYRSNDGGFTWSIANGNLPALLFSEIVTDKNGQVYVSSVSIVHTSTDNGNTWTTSYDGDTHWSLVPVTDWQGNIWIYTGDKLLKRVNDEWVNDEWVNVAGFVSYKEHFVVRFDQYGNIYAGTYSGILKSTDNGAAWSLQNNGLQAETIFNMARGAGNKIFAQKNYEVCFSTDRGNSWERLNTGAEMSGTDRISIHANGRGTVVYTEDSNILVSTDNGNKWVYPNTISSDRILSVAIDQDNNIYAISYNRVFFSDNLGINWEERFTWEDHYYWPKIITDDDGNVFVLRSDGIYKSVNKGSSFDKITPDVSNDYYEDFIITRKGIIIAGRSNGVMRLTRDGEVLGALVDPDNTSAMNSIVYESQNGTLYLNTYYNLFSSTDEGITWEPLKEIFLWNPDRCYVTDDDGYLYSGNERGVRKSSVPVLKITPPIPVVKPGDQKVYLSWNKNTSSEFKEYKIYGGSQPYPDSVIYTSTAGINDTTTIITNLINDTAYYFVVSAEDNNGNESFSNSLKVTPVPLPAVPELVSPANGEINMPKEFTLTWGAVPFAESYTIQFLTDSTLKIFAFQYAGFPFNSTGPPYLKSGTKYYWRVSSKNLAGESDFSVAWVFTTLLEAPELTAETAGIEKNKLTWVNKSNISPGYIVERKKNGSASFVIIDTVKSGDLYYTDNNAVSDIIYKYRVKAYTPFAVSEYSNEAEVTTITDVNDNLPLPTEYAVKQNYPNPFNPSTMIEYSLPYESNVKIVIYNSLGEVVAELADGVKSAGHYNVSFNAASMSSGIYFCSIRAESADGKSNYNDIKKMMLLK